MTRADEQILPADDPAVVAEIARLRASDILGAAGRLRELFDYLVQRSAADAPPKESEIAASVFGRPADNLDRDDPTPRVYVHRLRKKLEEFYLKSGPPEGVRIDVPRGEYRVVGRRAAEGAEGASPARPPLGNLDERSRRWALIAAALAVFAALNLAAWAVFARPRPDVGEALLATPLWSGVGATRPLLVVAGDYYMFGEYEDRLFLKRLIRDFAINSKDDLTNEMLTTPKAFEKYADVSLAYLPTSSAMALADLAPLLSHAREVKAVTASQLTPDMIKTHDIVYVGLLSGLGPLRDPTFTQSRFAIGKSFDILRDRTSGKTYESEAFLAAPSDAMYRDYGFVSRFRGPSGGLVIVLAGARDTGLQGLTDALARPDAAGALAKGLRGADAFEAIYEVQGRKQVNLETRLAAVSARTGDPWRRQSAEPDFPKQ